MQFLDFEKPLEDLYTQIGKLKEMSAKNKVDVSNGIKELEAAIESTKARIYENLTPWQRVQLSRHPERPYTLYYIEKVFTNFTELYGDRQVKDDKAMVGGMAELNGMLLVFYVPAGGDIDTRGGGGFGCVRTTGSARPGFCGPAVP